MSNQHWRLPKKQYERQGQFDVFPSHKGGHTTTYNGYVYELSPGHPLANSWGFVAQHRLVAETMIGRPLRKGEVVHHHDECRTNNRPENLAVMTMNEHRRHHARIVGEMSRAHLTEEMVRKALEGRSLKNAAKLLHVDTQTIRNRFHHLWLPRQRTSPTKIDDPRDIERVLAAATDQSIGLRELASELSMSASTICRICARNGVPWRRKSASTGRKRKLYSRATPNKLRTIRNAAQDPTVTLSDVAAATRLSPTYILRLADRHGIEWKRRLQKNRQQPSLTTSEADALRLELGLPPVDPRPPKRSRGRPASTTDGSA